jgi:hypothetical protein
MNFTPNSNEAPIFHFVAQDAVHDVVAIADRARGPLTGHAQSSLVCLARELRQVRAEVAPREVVATGGGADDPEGVRDFDVVAGVTGRAVVVDVEGEPRLAGVAEHELAVGVVVAGDAGGEDGDRDGAVAVADDRVVP